MSVTPPNSEVDVLPTSLQAQREATLSQTWCLPGKRLLLLVGAGMVPLVAVPFWADVLWLVLAFDVILLAGMLIDYSGLRRGAKLRVRRSRPGRLSVGADNPVSLEFTHLGTEPVQLWARDGYPGEFEAAGDDIGTNDEVTRGEELRPRLLELGRRRREHRSRLENEDRDLSAEREADKGAQGLRRRLARELTPGGDVGPGLPLLPRHRLRVTYMVTPLRRGDYPFGGVHVRLRSRLGLATLAGFVPMKETVQVYPNIQGVKQLGLATRFRDLRVLGLKSVRREGGGAEFEKLRDYVQGDSLRDINWKATARRRKPITQIYEAEKSQHIMLCIDAGRLMASRSGELLKLDHAINAALMLAYTALHGGDRVGVVVFADGIRQWLAPGRGQGHYRKILQALYSIEPELCHVDYGVLIKSLMGRARRRSMVVMFTDLHDEETARPLVKYTRLLMPKHLPLCVTMSDSHLHGLRHQIPTEEEEVYERAVATELLRERELLKGELLQMGAHVIDRPPEQITAHALNAYVELKRRRL